MTNAAARREPRLVRLALLHLALWAGAIAWRIVEATPATSTYLGGTFASSALGRATAMISILCGVALFVAVIVTTFQLRRRALVLVWFAALIASLARRGSPDAFDIAYLLIAPAIAAWILSVDRLREHAA